LIATGHRGRLPLPDRATPGTVSRRIRENVYSVGETRNISTARLKCSPPSRAGSGATCACETPLAGIEVGSREAAVTDESSTTFGGSHLYGREPELHRLGELLEGVAEVAGRWSFATRRG
jgi:hypothetical protein